MTSYTSGPWNIDAEHSDLLGQDKARFWINADGMHIAYVDGPRNIERTANARLIAAAPDLLEALRPFAEVDLRTQGVHHDFAHQVLRARAAIAKAEGGAA